MPFIVPLTALLCTYVVRCSLSLSPSRTHRGVLAQDALDVRASVQLVVKARGHGHLAVHVPVLDDDEVVPAQLRGQGDRGELSQ